MRNRKERRSINFESCGVSGIKYSIEEMKRVLLLFLFSKPIATSLFDDNLTIARILPLSITDHALQIPDHASPITDYALLITQKNEHS